MTKDEAQKIAMMIEILEERAANYPEAWSAEDRQVYLDATDILKRYL